MDPERLAEMRAYAAEVREDLERREAEDPLGAFELNQMRRAGPPALVFKVTDNAAVGCELESIGQIVQCDDRAPFTYEQTEIMAVVIAELRAELQAEVAATLAPLRERCARLEGQLTMLTTMLGAEESRAIDAPEVVRKLKVQR
jgi:hypothetical protein